MAAATCPSGVTPGALGLFPRAQSERTVGRKVAVPVRADIWLILEPVHVGAVWLSFQRVVTALECN